MIKKMAIGRCYSFSRYDDTGYFQPMYHHSGCTFGVYYNSDGDVTNPGGSYNPERIYTLCKVENLRVGDLVLLRSGRREIVVSITDEEFYGLPILLDDRTQRTRHGKALLFSDEDVAGDIIAIIKRGPVNATHRPSHGDTIVFPNGDKIVVK